MGFNLRFISGPIIEWLNKEKIHNKVPLSHFERIRYEIKPCDVILVEGRSRISEVIKIITQSAWSHAVLYIGRLHDIEDPKFRAKVADQFGDAPDTQLIVESLLGFGAVVRPLSNYENDHLRICRPKGLSYKDSQQAINFSISRLGLEYDFRQILDLARFLFPWTILPRRWRSSLFEHNAGRQTRTVCSSLIAEAFAYVQFPILPLVRQNKENEVHLFQRNPKLCTPKDFDYSPYFEIIKYPFIDCGDYGTYRLLPWHGSGFLVGREASLIQAATQNQARQNLDIGEELPEDDFMAEDADAHERRKHDPLIEEITSNESRVASFPSNDLPAEDLGINHKGA